MILNWVTVVFLVFALYIPTAAAECPVKDDGFELTDKITAAIKAAPDCISATGIYEKCTQGDNLDNETSSTTVEKCEPEFLPKLSEKDKLAYTKAQKKCEDKYANESGTMYNSFIASCVVEVAKTYVQRFGNE